MLFWVGFAKTQEAISFWILHSRVIIAEADEFDRSFLSLFPEIALVSSMDADHLDIYHYQKRIYRKGFESYIAQISEKGKLIYKLGLTPEDSVAPGNLYLFSG